EPQVQAQGQRLVAAGDALEQAHGNDPVRLGGWHGDWGHWNMGLGDGALKVLKVWDWERFDPEVPIGFDALHYAAQAVRPGQREEASQQETFLRSVPATLSALGVSPEDHQLTLRLYLLEIATRYVDALTHGATPALTRRTEWVLGLLEHHGEPAHHALVEGRS
ncbi:MAG TPA: hypothetical protein PLZ93_19095, partial [Nocardioides sp.]|nr:hypothetical protein [Nocardioides sp.]